MLDGKTKTLFSDPNGNFLLEETETGLLEVFGLLLLGIDCVKNFGFKFVGTNLSLLVIVAGRLEALELFWLILSSDFISKSVYCLGRGRRCPLASQTSRARSSLHELTV